MKRSGLINVELSAAIAALGHTDLMVVADCGLPRPGGVRWVDLALVFGMPSFSDVLNVLSREMVFEGAILTSEAAACNPGVVSQVTSIVPEPEWVSHEDFKRLLPDTALIIRTGEATPYANVALRCAVPFG